MHFQDVQSIISNCQMRYLKSVSVEWQAYRTVLTHFTRIYLTSKAYLCRFVQKYALQQTTQNKYRHCCYVITHYYARLVRMFYVSFFFFVLCCFFFTFVNKTTTKADKKEITWKRDEVEIEIERACMDGEENIIIVAL